MPSPLKSAATTESGYNPTVGLVAVAMKVPSPFPRRMVRVVPPLLEFDTARSMKPSPLKSAAATTLGSGTVAGLLELKKLRPVIREPSGAVPKSALLLLVSRNETDPVGAGNVGRLATPVTVAVSE